jgi:hypothetical protein
MATDGLLLGQEKNEKVRIGGNETRDKVSPFHALTYSSVVA